MIKLIISISIIILLGTIDQWIKQKILNIKYVLPIKKGIIKILYCENKGFALGKLDHRPKLVKNIVIGLYTITSLIFIYLSIYELEMYTTVSIAVMLGGGLGNIVDRVKRGYVIDYITLAKRKVPIFNFADFMIFIGGTATIVFSVIMDGITSNWVELIKDIP